MPPNINDRVGDLSPPALTDRVPDEPAPTTVKTPDGQTIPALNTVIGLREPGETPAPQARKAVSAAVQADVTPEFATHKYSDLTDGFEQERYRQQMAALPRLAQYANQSQAHTDSIKDDVDNLGVLDFVLGRPEQVPVPPSAVGPYADRQRAEGGMNDATPGWFLNIGRDAFNFVTNMKVFKQIELDGAVDMGALKLRQDVGGSELPGERGAIGKKLYGAQSLAQGFVPYALNPALTFGSMWAEGTAQTYLALRQHGYEHQEAAEIGNTAGFSSAVVGMVLGKKLTGSLLPKAAQEMMGPGISGAAMKSIYDRPAFWKFIRDVSINQLHAAVMNTGMALTDAAIVEGYDSYSRGHKLQLSVFTDTLDRAAMGSLQLLPLSAYAAMGTAKMRAGLYEAGGPFREFEAAKTQNVDVANKIADEYERQGHALRSLKEATDIDSAAQAISRSKFFAENPEEGKKLIRHMLEPRKSQSVFIDPEAFHGLPEEGQQAMNPKNAAEAAMTGSLVEVSKEDFLTSPHAPELTKDVAAAPDLLTAREALREPFDNAKLQEIAARGLGPAPTDEEIKAVLDDLRGLGFEIPANDNDLKQQPYEGFVHPDTFKVLGQIEGMKVEPEKLRPAPPMLGFKGKLSKERLRAWAEGEVEDRTIGSLETLQTLHRSNADAAEKRAAALQEQATGGLGRSTRKAQKGVSAGVESGEAGQAGAEGALAGTHSRGAVENLIDRSKSWVKKAEAKGEAAVSEEVKAGNKIKQVEKLKKVQKVNEAMMDAVKKAKGEANDLQQFVKDQGTPGARNRSYAASFEMGQARDAVLEALGGKPGGWSAPDVSDLYQGLRESALSEVVDFDPKFINRFLQEPKALEEMSLPEAREVKRFLQNTEDLSYAMSKMKAGEQFVDIEAMRAQVVRDLEKIPFKPPGQRSWLDSSMALTLRQRFGKAKAQAASELNQPYTIFAKMGKVGDALWFDQYVPGRNREERLHDEHMPRLKEIEESFPQEVRKTAKDLIQPLPGAPAKWGLRTRDEVWRLSLHLGTESGIKEISKALGVAPATLMQWTQANMGRTPEHGQTVMEKMIEPLWKSFGKLWEEYEPALRERGKPPPPALKVEPFALNGKTYSGGYGGRLRWLGEGWDHSVDPQSTAALFGLDYYGPSTAQAHLNERTGPQAGTFPDLAWGGVSGSARSEIHDLAFHGFVENTHKLLSDQRFRDMLSDKIGKQFIDQLYDPANKSSWLHVVAQGRIPDLNTLSATAAISNLQGRAAMSAFALNLRVVAMQASHIPAMAAGMGLNPMWSVRTFNPDRRAWAESVSQVLNYRQNDFERRNTDLIGQLTGVRPGEGVLAEKVPGMAALQQGMNDFNWSIWKEMDGHLSHALWEMGLEKGLRQGMSQQEAIREADRTVQRGMPAQTIYEQSAFVRDRKAIGLFFLVRNFPNTLYNVAALNAWQAQASGGSPALNALGTGAKYVGMALAAEMIGKGFFGGHLPKSDEDTDAWVVANAARSVFYPVMLDAPAEFAARSVMGDPQAAKRALGQLTPPGIAIATRALEDLGDAVTKDDQAGIRAAMDALGIATKLPIPRLYDWASSIYESDHAGELVGRGMGYQRGEQ